MAVKVTRQPDKIALLGAPTSAAALSPGHERAPEALRSAGLSEQLRAAGFEVIDHGDDPVQLSQPDEESPRARNLPRVVKSLEALRPRVEIAVKSGALPVILSGDCTMALATVAGRAAILPQCQHDLHGSRRGFECSGDYAVWVRRWDGGGASYRTRGGGIGAFLAGAAAWCAIRISRYLAWTGLIRRRKNFCAARRFAFFRLRIFDARERRLRRAVALDRVHAARNEFIVHFDVDVIENFGATNYSGSGGLTLEEVRPALEVFLVEPRLVAIDIAAYNPEKDPDGSGG